MPKKKDLNYDILDVIVEFYDKYIKPDMRQAIDEVVGRKLDEKFDEKFDEHLGPMKASIMKLERNVDFALGDYKGQQMQVSDHEKRITHLESQVLHP